MQDLQLDAVRRCLRGAFFQEATFNRAVCILP